MPVPNEKAAEILQKRLQARILSLSPDNPRFREVLYRIGLRIESDAKMNIRAHGMIDRGALLNSIQTKIEQKGESLKLTVGSFGVPYAAINEFGRENVSRAQIKAMFGALKRRGLLDPNKARPSKGVLDVKARRWKARPFLQPAFDKHAPSAILEMRDLFRDS